MVRAVPSPVVPAGQENGFIRTKDAPITITPWLPFGKRRALEIPLHGTSAAANLMRDGVQGPTPLMLRPYLLVMDPPLRTPILGQSCSRGGRLMGGTQDGEPRWGYSNTGWLMQRRGPVEQRQNSLRTRSRHVIP
jgi:hypothetical protein